MFRELDRDGLDEQVPLLPVPRTVSNFISPFLHTGQEEEEEDSDPLFLASHLPFDHLFSLFLSLAACLLLSRNFRFVNP